VTSILDGGALPEARPRFKGAKKRIGAMRGAVSATARFAIAFHRGIIDKSAMEEAPPMPELVP
jgi:hypothetical protein